MGLFSSVVGGIFGAKANREVQRGAERASELAAYKPYDVTTGIGSVDFDRHNQTATTKLDPRYQAFVDQMLGKASDYMGREDQIPQLSPELLALGTGATGKAQGFLDSLYSFDPFDAANEHFSRLDSMLQPGRDSARQSLESKLLRQGRLGSINTNAGGDITGGGAADQMALEQAIEQQRQKGLYDSFAQAQGVQNNLSNLFAGMGQFGGQMEDAVANREAMQFGREGDIFNRALLGLQGATTLEQMPMDIARLGGAFGQAGAAAGANQAQHIMSAANTKAGTIASFGKGLSESIDGFMPGAGSSMPGWLF